MIDCTEKDGALCFAVRVAPNASRSQIVGEFDKQLRVRVAAPPVEGAANEELIRCLARAFKVPRRDVEITSGHALKSKPVRVRGGTREMLEKLSKDY